MSTTHTVAELAVSGATYHEIASKLRAAGYGHAFDPRTHAIDMSGIALVRSADPDLGLDVQGAAESLVETATAQGVVLTIEQQPLQPLAMGNYASVVLVRPVVVREAPAETQERTDG